MLYAHKQKRCIKYNDQGWLEMRCIRGRDKLCFGEEVKQTYSLF